MRIVIFPIMCHFPRGDKKNSLLIALHCCTKIKFHAADSSVFFNLIDTKLNIKMVPTKLCNSVCFGPS